MFVYSILDRNLLVTKANAESHSNSNDTDLSVIIFLRQASSSPPTENMNMGY